MNTISNNNKQPSRGRSPAEGEDDMKKYTSENADLYIGTAREVLSLLKNLEKRGIAVYPYMKASCNMMKMYGLKIEYYSEYEERFHDVPRMTILTADSVLVELVCENYKEVR